MDVQVYTPPVWIEIPMKSLKSLPHLQQMPSGLGSKCFFFLTSLRCSLTTCFFGQHEVFHASSYHPGASGLNALLGHDYTASINASGR